MSGDLPRFEVSGPGADKSVVVGTQRMLPSHMVAVPGVGDVLFHHATAVCVSEILIDDMAPRIAIQIATPGCRCGCGASGRGLVLTPGPDEARLIARQLVDVAEKHEAAAAAQATAAISKARGK